MKNTARTHSFRVSHFRWLVILIGGQAVIFGIVVWSLFAARRWALTELSTPKAIGQWETWREDVRQQATRPGPVRRRVPNSAEPPALVLMRDYFAVSLVGSILFTTLLYWVIAWFMSGIMRPVVGKTIEPNSKEG
jgi:hypothetical protein